jgi:Peptidase family M28
MSETALKHIEHLSITIGPRGTATPDEHTAQDYVEQTLTGLGYEPQHDAVQVYASAYQPFILGLTLMLVAFFLFYYLGGAGALAATVLGAIVTVSAFLELMLKDNPLRWFLPLAPSQNIYAVAPAQSESESPRKIVVVAHVDTHRTPLIWSSPGMFSAYRVLSALGMVGLPVGVIVFVVGIFVTSNVVRQIGLGLAVLYGLLWLLVIQAEFSEHTRGANDNASGVGVLLSLAERLKHEPLPNSEVWLLADTAEETGAFGMRDFVVRHKDDLPDAVFLVVDSVAGEGAGPCTLRSEMFFSTLHYPADLLALADKVAADHPDLGAYSHAMQGAYTDGAIALKAGYEALAWVGYTKDGWIPLWHSPDDEFELVDKSTLDRTEEFVWEVMRRLDGERP